MREVEAAGLISGCGILWPDLSLSPFGSARNTRVGAAWQPWAFSPDLCGNALFVKYSTKFIFDFEIITN
jgi:hypothetical protein